MATCSESYKKLLRTLHNICIYSNIFYLIAALLIFITFKGYFKILGVYLLLICTVSVIHHSNKDVGLKANLWSKLDVSLANIGGIIALIILLYLLFKKKIHKQLAICTIIMGFLSIVFFIFSEIESKRAKKNLNSNDPTKSWGGNIFTVTKDVGKGDEISLDYTGESQQAMYLCYHTFWHILSGLTAIFWVVSVITKP
jgi:hypothetical protein